MARHHLYIWQCTNGQDDPVAYGRQECPDNVWLLSQLSLLRKYAEELPEEQTLQVVITRMRDFEVHCLRSKFNSQKFEIEFWD